MHTLQEFGWVLNLKKSAPTPTRHLEYLEPIFNLARAKVFLPPDKLCTFWTAVWWSYLHYGIQVLGHTVSTFDVVRYVQFHMRFLQK